MVRVVPKLCGDKNLFARNAGLLDRATNGSFGAIDARCVDVTVAGLESDRDGTMDKSASISKRMVLHVRFLSVLVLPGTKPNGWDLSSSIELERGSVVRHSGLRLWLYMSSYLRKSCSRSVAD